QDVKTQRSKVEPKKEKRMKQYMRKGGSLEEGEEMEIEEDIEGEDFDEYGEENIERRGGTRIVREDDEFEVDGDDNIETVVKRKAYVRAMDAKGNIKYYEKMVDYTEEKYPMFEGGYIQQYADDWGLQHDIYRLTRKETMGEVGGKKIGFKEYDMYIATRDPSGRLRLEPYLPENIGDKTTIIDGD